MIDFNTYLIEGPNYQTWQNKAIRSFLDLEPINKTTFTEYSRKVSEIVDCLDQSLSLIESKVEVGKTTYGTIEILAAESIEFQEVNKNFLHELRRTKSKSMLKKYKYDQLTEFVQSVYDARLAWHLIKDAFEKRREEWKSKIVTKVIKPKEPSTLKEFIPIYKIPTNIVKQLEIIETELYNKLFQDNLNWLNRLVESNDGREMTEKTYREIKSYHFKQLLKWKDGVVTKIADHTKTIDAIASMYTRGSVDFIIVRMFKKIKNINFQFEPEFVYDVKSAGSTHFYIRINKIKGEKSDAFLSLDFSMILNHSIYGTPFNQFPTKLYITENNKTEQIAHF